MCSRLGIPALILLSSLGNLARSQEPIQVDQKTLSQDVLHQTYPHYPSKARESHVSGKVVLQVTVTTEGTIESIKAVSGPPLLMQAAIDCVKQWTFKPFFHEGLAVRARGEIWIVFSLGGSPNPPGPVPPTPPSQRTVTMTSIVNVSPPDEAGEPAERLDPQFDPAWEACSRAVMARQRDLATAEGCGRAADFAAQFSPDHRFAERRRVFVYAATAFANLGDFRRALLYAKQAVDVVKLGHDSSSGNGAAYSTYGTVEALAGDLASGDRDLSTGEDFERKTIAAGEKDGQGRLAGDRQSLAKDLLFHAQLLEKLGRTSEAQSKRDEAAKL